VDCSALLTHEARLECWAERAALAAEAASPVGALADFAPVVLVILVALLAVQLGLARA
jgi:hypothetical protein